MRFVFKLVVLAIIGLAVLPAFAPERYRLAATGAEDDPQAPSPYRLVAVIGQAASDLGNICTRQPGVCETGSELVSFVAAKAREGLEIAYAMFRHGHPSMQREGGDSAPTGTAAE
ncbi:MAG: hypothetical protein Kow0026_24020 [Oricola sp.]